MATWNLSKTYAHIFICNGSSCTKNGGEEVTKAIRQALKVHHLNDYIHTSRTKCNGRCEDACTVIVYPEGTWYHEITPDDCEPLVQAISAKRVLAHKVSHTFEKSGFERHNDVQVGRLRSEKKQKATSDK